MTWPLSAMFKFIPAHRLYFQLNDSCSWHTNLAHIFKGR